MRFKQVGNKADDIILVVHNADTVALLPGQAAILNGLNGTNDGLDVVGPNNATTNFAGFDFAYLYGVVVSPAVGGIPAGGFGEVQAFGFCRNVQFTLATRASTNSTWPSYAAVNGVTAVIGLYPETLANGFSTNALQSFRTDAISTGNAVAFTQYLPPVVLGTSFASFTTLASSIGSGTALTLAVKAFVRIL